MVKTINSFDKLVIIAAEEKLRAIKNRNIKKPINIEKSREVFLGFCENLGNYYEKSGFKFIKSGPFIKKYSVDKEWLFQISFWSNYNNVSGEYVVFSFDNIVESKTLKKWSKEQALFSNPATGYIGSIKTEKFVDTNAIIHLSWNIAHEKERFQAFKEVTYIIDQVVLPYFKKFKNPEDLICDYANPLNWNEYGVVVPMKFLLCFGTIESAQNTAREFLKQRPDLINCYKEELMKIEEKKLPPYFVYGGFATELAQFSKAFNLGDLSV
jgi:hypothetical protein